MSGKGKQDKIYGPSAFNIAFSIGYFTDNTPSDKIKKHGDRLRKITDLRSKLQYYNENICSLSYSPGPGGLYTYGNISDEYGNGEKFFSINPRISEFEIYLDERKKEIDRLNSLINSKSNYRDRLKCFIEQKSGQRRPTCLKVEKSEWLFHKEGPLLEELNNYRDRFNIYLEPDTEEEVSQYNLYLMNYIRKTIEDPDYFHVISKTEYKGFLSEPAFDRFSIEVNKTRSDYRSKKIDFELNEIETQFKLYQLKGVKNSLNNLSDINWMATLFNAFVNGIDFDFSKNQLSLDGAQKIIHVEQVFEYYKKLLNLKAGVKNNKQDKLETLNWSFLKDILTTEGFAHIKELMIEMDIISGDDQTRLSPGKGVPLFALIDLLTNNKYKVCRNKILKKEMSKKYLLQKFNALLKTDYKEAKATKEKTNQHECLTAGIHYISINITRHSSAI